MRFLDLAATSAVVTATSARGAKVELPATALRDLTPAEIPAGAFLAGDLRLRQTGVGYASLRELPPPADQPTRTVAAKAVAVAAWGGGGTALVGITPRVGRPLAPMLA